ncbi:hypothetical protein [Alteromonas sp. a30]|uniref:hypothetical protein n=1 Tax=Alteromonas sp. a30 TaxID=2730917 RepID=UPI00227F574A|nr:hypothetical protein [Alteromonas sp. a30]MCY7295048.1 hypothetical protein [Alteromonas sp. a30]
MKDAYKILSFAITLLLTASGVFNSPVAMANNNTSTQLISVSGSGGGLTPIPTGSGDGLRPDPTYGSGGGLTPDPSARYDGIVASGSGDGLFPDPNSTEAPATQTCFLGWCFSF